MIVHLEELEVGLCYRYYSNEYLCLYKTNNFVIMLCYSTSHYVGTLEFWDDDTTIFRDLEVIPDSDYPFTEYIDKLKCVDNQTIKYKD